MHKYGNDKTNFDPHLDIIPLVNGSRARGTNGE